MKHPSVFHLKIYKLLRLLLLGASLLLAALLIFHCVDLYRLGHAPENFTPAGVKIQPVFSREGVQERFGQMAWALWLWLGLLAAALIAGFGIPRETDTAVSGCGKPAQGAELLWLRWLLLGAALVFLVLGFFNGSLADVVVKAVNICTECIGLG